MLGRAVRPLPLLLVLGLLAVRVLGPSAVLVGLRLGGVLPSEPLGVVRMGVGVR